MARSADYAVERAGRAIAEARRHIPITQAVLFGSYVTGTPHEHSDVDLAIFSPAVDDMKLDEALELLVMIVRATDHEVEVHLFGENDLENARPSNFAGHILSVGKRVA